MRILFLLTQDLESPSGLGRYLPLAQELVRSGHQVKIAALHSNYRKLTSRRLNIKGVDVHYVAQMHVKKQGNIKTYFSPFQLAYIMLKATFMLTISALGNPADLIHIAKPHPMNGIAGIIAKWLQGKQLFLDCDDYEAASNRFGNRWQQSIIAFFEKRIPMHAKIITTNTHFMEQKLISWGIQKEKIVYLPNGIDPNRFPIPNKATLETLKNQINIQNRKVVAYIGTISLPSHPIDLLLRAFPDVLNKVPDSVLMIVGGGEDIPVLEQLAIELEIQDFVHFIGRVPPEDVYLYYGLSDVTVDPVHDDDTARSRSPLKLFESWICGVPFVSMAVGDRTQLLGFPPSGILIDTNNPSHLAQNLIKILETPLLAHELSERGLNKVQQYHWGLISQTLSEKYV